MNTALEVDHEDLAAFCRLHGIRRLALFGSVSRRQQSPGSDVDLLVEFEPGRTPGLIRLASLELKLSLLLGGREVELRTYGISAVTSGMRCEPKRRLSMTQPDEIRIRHMAEAAQKAIEFCRGRSRQDLETMRSCAWA